MKTADLEQNGTDVDSLKTADLEQNKTDVESLKTADLEQNRTDVDSLKTADLEQNRTNVDSSKTADLEQNKNDVYDLKTKATDSNRNLLQKDDINISKNPKSNDDDKNLTTRQERNDSDASESLVLPPDILNDYYTPNVLDDTCFELQEDISDITQRSEIDTYIDSNDDHIIQNDIENQRKRHAKAAFKSSCIDFTSDNEDFSSGSCDLWSPYESEGTEDENNRQKRKKYKKKKSHKKQSKQLSLVNEKVLSRKKVSRVNKRKSQRELRIMGKPYETRNLTPKEEKSLKANPCERDKCTRCCYDISEEKRKGVFDYFWSLDEQRRRDWIAQHSRSVVIKRKRIKMDISRRNKTYEYYINEGEGQRQVCQKFLINTLDVTQKYMIYTIEHAIEGMAQTDQRAYNTPLKYSEEVKKYVREFLDQLPAVSSHYCRRQSKKLYLPQDFKNVANLYRIYSQNCIAGDVERISEVMFRKIFNEEYNLSFHVPKKDKCVQCVKSENEKELSENERNALATHLEEKKASYRRFNVHQNLQSEDTVTTSFDLQKVLNTPYGESMLLYYSRKYSMYNLTFYESQTQNGFCFLWGESDAKRGSNEIATCVTKYLQNVDERGIKNVLLYCDACPGQNKNKIVLTSLHHFLKTSKSIQVIQINFLLPGHSYMPVDSMHAIIEREVKKLIVWSPSQWPTYIEAARKNPFPYKVEVLEYSDILDWNELANDTFKNDPIKTFQKIRIVTFKKKNINAIEVKYSMKDNAEKQIVEVMQKPKTKKGKGRGKNKVTEKLDSSQNIDKYLIQSLYSSKQPLSQQKYNDLRKLCLNGTIPKRFHSEYISLPTATRVPDTLAETDDDEGISEDET